MDESDALSLTTLEERRTKLRSRLARAWELREPLEQIHKIEDQLSSIWTQIDALESEAAPASRPCV
jgi:chromosome segregation ATPase